MKFLSWLFDMYSRHLGDAIRYEKGKVSTKIFAIVFLLIFGSATIGVEYWGFSLLNDSFVGIVVLILLFAPLLATTVEFCTFYSCIGFKMFLSGTLETIIRKAENKKRSKKSVESLEIQTTEQTTKIKKNHHWLDLLVGILSILIGLAVVVLAFVVPSI